MGCDAHPVIETLGADGVWTAVQSEAFQDYDNCPQPCRYLGGRNYRRFSILYGVRNYGKHPITPLFADRGMPVDASVQAQEELEVKWSGDIHSLTYFTLEELMKVDWDSPAGTMFEVTVFGDAYQYVLEHKRLPDDWVDDWGGDRNFVSEAEMQLLLVAGAGMPTAGSSALKEHKSGPVVDVLVAMSYYQIDPTIKDRLIPELTVLGAGISPDRVRIVVGFDN